MDTIGNSSQTEQAVENALKLEGSEFKGRQLKVTHKRVNQPGFIGMPPDDTGRGGGRTVYRGGYRGGRGGRAVMVYAGDVSGRGFRGGGFRGRGRGRGGRSVAYHPYY
jgi:polyadenylate-binding protein 2